MENVRSKKYGFLKVLVRIGNAVLATAKDNRDSEISEIGGEVAAGLLARTLLDWKPEGRCWTKPEFFIVGRSTDEEQSLVTAYHVESDIQEAIRRFKGLSEVLNCECDSDTRGERHQIEAIPSPVRVILKNGAPPQ